MGLPAFTSAGRSVKAFRDGFLASGE
eukprot:gene27099-biopygen17656